MIPTKKKYTWEQTPDGRYNIYNVDIFRTGQEGKEIISTEDAKKIITSFNADKAGDWLPRVHIAHQNYNDTKNCTGVGYIDNLCIKNKIFFADLIDISKQVFEEIMMRKYPYRSVELDTAKKRIVGLALLESRPPFFSFPVLDLEQFQDKQQIIFFSSEEVMELEENKTTEEPKKPDKDNPDNGNKLPEGDTVAFLSADEIEQLRRFLSVSDRLMGLASIADKLATNSVKPVEKKEERLPEEKPEVSNAAIPEVIACELQTLRKKIEQFEKDNQNIGIYSQLKNICDKDPSINFEKEVKFLEKFESKRDKETYVERLSAKKGEYEEHFISQFATKFKGEELKEFQGLAGEKRTVYLNAKRDYIDTMKSGNAKQFGAMYPTLKEYVDAMLLQYELTGTTRPEYI